MLQSRVVLFGRTQGARLPSNGCLGLLQPGNSLNYTSIRSSAHLAIQLDDSRSEADSEDGTESDVRRVEMGSRIFCLDGLGLFLYEPPLVLSCQGSGEDERYLTERLTSPISAWGSRCRQ